MKICNLSEKGFLQLLSRLNADPTLAGEEYEKLRARLIYFFERKGSRIPAELSDEAINRVARKMEEGQVIEDLFKFSFGVARLVLLEHWKDSGREWQELDDHLPSPGNDREFDERRLQCMKKCLQSLSPEEKNLIVKNSILNKNGKEELVRTQGITINALRLRVFRIRAKLQQCCEGCIGDL